MALRLSLSALFCAFSPFALLGCITIWMFASLFCVPFSLRLCTLCFVVWLFSLFYCLIYICQRFVYVSLYCDMDSESTVRFFHILPQAALGCCRSPVMLYVVAGISPIPILRPMLLLVWYNVLMGCFTSLSAFAPC